MCLGDSVPVSPHPTQAQGPNAQGLAREGHAQQVGSSRQGSDVNSVPVVAVGLNFSPERYKWYWTFTVLRGQVMSKNHATHSLPDGAKL